jgi:hypothetical protein
MRLRPSTLCRVVFVSASLSLFCLAGSRPIASQSKSSADQAQAQEVALPSSAAELVSQTMQNELKQSDSRAHFMYRIRRQTPAGSQTKEYVETSDGAVARLMAVNDQPLTEDQRQKEDERLQKLLTDPQAQQKHRKEQQDDEQRVQKMLRALPDAFLYQYDGKETFHGAEVVRLRFNPNPNFTPANHESQVYRGMMGTMLIDPRVKRLAKIDGHIIREVSFGWGILGHLDPGGHFVVEQAEVGEGVWETISSVLSFTGRVLLFKRLNIQETEVASYFVHAPSGLNLAKGIELLKSQNPVVAQQSR